MKAVICTKYGPPEVLKLTEVEKPVPKHKEILVQIFSSAVNSGDVRVRGLKVKGVLKIVFRFVIGFIKPRRPILGTVFAGIVAETGKGVTQFGRGDKVFGITGFKFGTHAQYTTVPEEGNVILKPVNASFEQAAAILFGGQTAIYFLEKAGIRTMSKPRVLIIGGTGSVGTAAIQIAKYYNADITVVCGSKGVKTVQALGVSTCMVYDKEDFTQCGSTFDIVFDAVGKTTRKQCRHLLRPTGVYKSVAGLEYAVENKEQLFLLRSLFEKGEYDAVIDRVFTIEDIVAAHRYVDTGRKKGNVVLRIFEGSEPERR